MTSPVSARAWVRCDSKTGTQMRLLITAILLSTSTPALAQGAPGTNLTVDVTVSSITFRGDTAVVSYVLHNRSSSTEQLFTFIVDAPATPTKVTRPQPVADWVTQLRYRTRSVASWTVLGNELMPGEQSPALVFEAEGLPKPVTYWYRGYTPPPKLTQADTAPVVPPSDPLTQNSVAGTGVGIEPLPNPRTAAGLLGRLRGLLDQGCAAPLLWITDSAVCTHLGAKLDSASQRLSVPDTAGTRRKIRNFIAELGVQHGTGQPVTDSAYWMLKANAEYILARAL